MSKKKTGKRDKTQYVESSPASIKSWVFLSHSNLDYERVTFVRNVLERNNKRPIMFFLKCIEKEEELSDLLKREIDARDQFILCDSENARRSKWVQDEVKYIKSKGRVYQTINLYDPDEMIEMAVSDFVDRSNVFITYSRRDLNLAKLVVALLRKNGFDVLYGLDSVEAGELLSDTISGALDIAGRSGYHLVLLSKTSMDSVWCWDEVKYFISKYGEKWVIPVITDEMQLCDAFPRPLLGVPICDVSIYDSLEKKAQAIVEFLIRRDHELSE